MTTEYHDPDGVFPLLWPQLSAHLPLRNLCWKSPTRSLRAIASLDVDFVPAWVVWEVEGVSAGV